MLEAIQAQVQQLAASAAELASARLPAHAAVAAAPAPGAAAVPLAVQPAHAAPASRQQQQHQREDAAAAGRLASARASLQSSFDSAAAAPAPASGLGASAGSSAALSSGQLRVPTLTKIRESVQASPIAPTAGAAAEDSGLYSYSDAFEPTSHLSSSSLPHAGAARHAPAAPHAASRLQTIEDAPSVASDAMEPLDMLPDNEDAAVVIDEDGNAVYGSPAGSSAVSFVSDGFGDEPGGAARSGRDSAPIEVGDDIEDGGDGALLVADVAEQVRCL